MQQHQRMDIPHSKPESLQRGGHLSAPWRLLSIIAIFVLLASAEYIFLSMAAPLRRPNAIDVTNGKKDFILSIKGLETAKVSGDQKLRLKIGCVMVVPRKFFVFSIQPLNEALFEDFSVAFFRQPQSQSMFALSDIQQTLLPTEGKGMLFSGLFNVNTGVITRGGIRRFTLTVYDGNEIKTVVKSARAEMDFKNNKIRLEDASIEQHDFKRIIKSSEAVLKNTEGTLNIPGKYSILHAEGVLKGSGVKIKL